MASNIYSVGLRNVGSYQVSGTPWVTGSNFVGGAGGEICVKFPYVAKSLFIKIRGDDDPGTTQNSRISLVSYYQNNADNHYLMGFMGREYILTGKFKEIYFSIHNPSHESGFELVAELTNIPTSSMFTLTGSGVDE